MEEATVQAIKQRAVKTGTGAKGAWQQDIVILDTGEEVRIFAPIEVGDPVESYDNEYNGKTYKNWRLKDGAQSSGAGPKPAGSSDGSITTDQIYAEVLKQGKQIQEILDRLRVMNGEPAETPAVKEEQATAAADKAAAEKPDVVIEDIGDEPINLDDIPF
jgi:hypothetical protein